MFAINAYELYITVRVVCGTDNYERRAMVKKLYENKIEKSIRFSLNAETDMKKSAEEPYTKKA